MSTKVSTLRDIENPSRGIKYFTMVQYPDISSIPTVCIHTKFTEVVRRVLGTAVYSCINRANLEFRDWISGRNFRDENRDRISGCVLLEYYPVFRVYTRVRD